MEAEQKENRGSIVQLANILPRGILKFSVLFFNKVSGKQRDLTGNHAISSSIIFCLSETHMRNLLSWL